MRCVGLDVHKKLIVAAVLSATGEVVARHRFECTREAIGRFALEHLAPTDEVALEATANTWAVVDLLEPHVARVAVGNPLKTRLIAEARVKTDKVDATVLAQLLRTKFLPEVWVPPPETRRRRQIVSRRASLVHDRTAIKNRIHAVLHQRLIHAPVDRLFGKRGRAFLEQLELDELGRAVIDSELRLLDAIEREITAQDDLLARLAWTDEKVRLLMTAPGVDFAVAHALMACLGNVERFESGKKAASYLGLVPGTRESAGKAYDRPITKQGASHVRWLMIQAAQHLGRHPGPLGHFFRRLKKKKGHNRAVVATARKLVVIAWHMLKNDEPYRYAQPRTTETKLARLRVRATGERRKTGPRKGSAPAKNQGTGRRTRTVRSIDEVYAIEGLPGLPELAPGERKTVRKAAASRFVQEIHTTRRIPRNANKENAS